MAITMAMIMAIIYDVHDNDEDDNDEIDNDDDHDDDGDKDDDDDEDDTMAIKIVMADVRWMFDRCRRDVRSMFDRPINRRSINGDVVYNPVSIDFLLRLVSSMDRCSRDV